MTVSNIGRGQVSPPVQSRTLLQTQSGVSNDVDNPTPALHRSAQVVSNTSVERRFSAEPSIQTSIRKTRSTPRRLARSTRGPGYTSAELDALLDSVMKILPVSALEWKQVSNEFEVKWGKNGRTVDSIRRKFNGL